MIILNFKHPLTQEHIAQVEALVGKVSRIVELPVQFDNEQGFCFQLAHLIPQVPLSTEVLQTEPVEILTTHSARAPGGEQVTSAV